MHRDPEKRFAVNVIEDADGRLLMLKRATHLQRAPGQWGFVSGEIETGETPSQCAAREIGEEIGTALRLELRQQLGPIRNRHHGGHFEFFLFHYDFISGSISLNDEHSKFAWVSREEFSGYDAMPGLDEDIRYLDIWPRRYAGQAPLPVG